MAKRIGERSLAKRFGKEELGEEVWQGGAWRRGLARRREEEEEF